MLRSTWTYFGLGALVGAALFWVSDSSGWLVTPGLGDVAEAPLAPREERIEGSRPASSAVQEQSSTRPPTSTTSSSGLTTTSSDPVCELPLCQLHERSAPQLFILEHTDGAGHRMKSILEAMAIAWRNKMNFGGLGRSTPALDGPAHQLPCHLRRHLWRRGLERPLHLQHQQQAPLGRRL
ncbi:unnamed protein product [Durusdinium trenchii]|uniref:Uncharacterized protein n=1 Tax=Durusdinium trenchii TaxID=1381693 RepID=A0ABP0MH36_9DINO